MSRPPWRLLLSVLGLAVSAYLVATHYFADQVPLACGSGGIVDCQQVTTSAEAFIGPVPVAVLGLLWFLGFLAIELARGAQPRSRLAMLQVYWTGAGLVFVFYLVYAELFLIGAICAWCTVVHAIVAILFLVSVYDATAPAPA